MEKRATITRQPQTEIHAIRITTEDIARVKEQNILQNLLYTTDQVGKILGVSTQTVYTLIKDGHLIAADRSGKASAGTRVTAESLTGYRKSIIIPKEKWKE